MSEAAKPRIEVSIAPFDPWDVGALADVAATSYADAFGMYVKPEDLEDHLANQRSVKYFEQAAQIDRILVAKQGGKIVAYVQYGDVKEPEVAALAQAGDKELSRLYVETDLHGQGIGRQLMDAAFNDPELADAPNVFLVAWERNKKALPLYEDYGFQRVGSFEWTMGNGQPSTDFIMCRPKQT